MPAYCTASQTASKVAPWRSLSTCPRSTTRVRKTGFDAFEVGWVGWVGWWAGGRHAHSRGQRDGCRLQGSRRPWPYCGGAELHDRRRVGRGEGGLLLQRHLLGGTLVLPEGQVVPDGRRVGRSAHEIYTASATAFDRNAGGGGSHEGGSEAVGPGPGGGRGVPSRGLARRRGGEGRRLRGAARWQEGARS